MNVLSFNVGGATLKFRAIGASPNATISERRRVLVSERSIENICAERAFSLFENKNVAQDDDDGHEAIPRLLSLTDKEDDMATSMNRIERVGRIESNPWGATLEGIGEKIIRYGLVVILLWIGALKFTAYEAENIQGLVANSPLMSWGYSVLTTRGFSGLIGVIEITLGILIALRPISPKLSAIGSLGAIGLFLVTLSFILTTPGVWQQGYGFPFPSSSPGQFLLKDLVNLGAATYTAGEALRAARL